MDPERLTELLNFNHRRDHWALNLAQRPQDIYREGLARDRLLRPERLEHVPAAFSGETLLRHLLYLGALRMEFLWLEKCRNPESGI